MVLGECSKCKQLNSYYIPGERGNTFSNDSIADSQRRGAASGSNWPQLRLLESCTYVHTLYAPTYVYVSTGRWDG